MEGFVYTAVNVKNGQNFRISATEITNSVQSYEKGFLSIIFQTSVRKKLKIGKRYW